VREARTTAEADAIASATVGGPTGAIAHGQFRAQSTFASLDGLRGLSILAVIWHHAIDQRSPLIEAFPPGRFGFLGVDLFFVISGFLIVTLLLRERDRNGAISLRNFYVRRSLRIFPLYYALIAVFAAWYFFRTDPKALQFKEALPYLVTYTTNWFPVAGMFAITWSLSAEEQFYLVWPSIERFARRYALAVLLLLLVASQVIHFGWADPILERLLGWQSTEPAMLRETTFTPILLGVLLAYTLHNRASFDLVSRMLGHAYAAPLALAWLTVVLFSLPDDIRGWGRLNVHLAMMALVATAVIREDHGMARFYGSRPLVLVGVVSYGLYLLHHIGIAIADQVLAASGYQHDLMRLVLGFLVSLALAAASYRFFETPFLSLKKRFP
jgi:peptidoglycan/LPS O-acetylase OafA/YrhL